MLVKNNTKYENGQHSPKKSWANYLIFEYIRIVWTNIIICKNICWFFLGRIYSNIQSWFFYHAKYIRISICPISMVTKIFGYSFVQKQDICPTLVVIIEENWIKEDFCIVSSGLSTFRKQIKINLNITVNFLSNSRDFENTIDNKGWHGTTILVGKNCSRQYQSIEDIWRKTFFYTISPQIASICCI